MKNNKLHIKLLFALLFSVVFLLFSCASKTSKFKDAGGILKFAFTHQPSEFEVYNVNDFYSSTLLDQLYEGLVKLNPITLEVEPQLAESWEVLEDGKKIIFTLRKGVRFHESEELKEAVFLTVEDVIYSFERACTPHDGKESFAYTTIFKDVLVGAKAFFEGKESKIKGAMTEGNTIVFELHKKDANFLNKLTHTCASILSKKVVEAGYETKLIGTGPFMLQNKEEDNLFVLQRNPHYYLTDTAGNQLPYLDGIEIVVEPNPSKQVELFNRGEIDFLDELPPNKVAEMLGEERIEDFNGVPPRLLLIREPLLATHFYYFNMNQEKFQDKRIRKAINYAINRQEIVKKILKNQANSIGDAGLVPPAVFKGYDVESVRKSSYSFQPEKAKRLMAAAGFPEGEDFPEITLTFDEGTLNRKVAQEVAKQLKETLNITIVLEELSFSQKLEKQNFGEGDIFKSTWYADYYSPESFLMKGYGKIVPTDSTQPSKINHGRYVNATVDSYFEKAQKSDNIMDQYADFSKAEALMMEDAPFIILWYEETIKIVNSTVRNLHFNTKNYYQFQEVYFKDWTKSEWEARPIP